MTPLPAYMPGLSYAALDGSIFIDMATRKDAGNGRPQISQVSPEAAIAGGELQIHGKGFAATERPSVQIGEVAAPIVIGSDSFVIAKVPEAAGSNILIWAIALFGTI